MSDIQRIGVGNAKYPPIDENDIKPSGNNKLFTFDRTDITFDSTTDTFDEEK